MLHLLVENALSPAWFVGLMWRTQTKFNIAKFTQLHSRRSTYFRWLVPDNIFRKLVFVDFFLLCHRTRISFPNYLVTFISILISQLIILSGYFRRNFRSSSIKILWCRVLGILKFWQLTGAQTSTYLTHYFDRFQRKLKFI